MTKLGMKWLKWYEITKLNIKAGMIYISLWIDCLFEIRKIAVCFLWLSLPGHYRVTDEALLAETT